MTALSLTYSASLPMPRLGWLRKLLAIVKALLKLSGLSLPLVGILALWPVSLLAALFIEAGWPVFTLIVTSVTALLLIICIDTARMTAPSGPPSGLD